MTEIGMYLGWGAKRYAEAKGWLGRDLDFVQLHGGLGAWGDWRSSLPGNIRDWRKNAPGVRLHLSQPLFADGGRLDAAGDGAYDVEFRALADAVTSALSGYQGDVPIRFGVEYNATTWMRWRLGLTGDAKDYANAWRRIVTAFRSQPNGERFKPILCPNFGEQNPVPAWPGKEFVSFLGMDFYDDPRFDGSAAACFNRQRTHAYGLDMLLNWAAKEGVPASFDEFGCRGTTPERAADYVRLCGEYFTKHKDQIAHVSYFNEDFHGSIPDKVELDEGRPAARTAFRAVMPWGTGTVEPGPIVVTPPSLPPVPTAPPPPPMGPDMVVMGRVNGDCYADTFAGTYKEPLHGYLRTWEGAAWGVLAKAGHKAGTPPAEQETDLGKVATFLRRDMLAKASEFPAAGAAKVLAMADALKAFAEPDVEVPKPTEPAPVPAEPVQPPAGTDPAAAQIAQMQAAVKLAQDQVKAAQAENDSLRQQLAAARKAFDAVKAALGL